MSGQQYAARYLMSNKKTAFYIKKAAFFMGYKIYPKATRSKPVTSKEASTDFTY